MQCGPCQLDNQCELIEICSPITQLCQLRNCFGTCCTVNDNCPLGNFCVQGLCLPTNGEQVSDACTVDAGITITGPDACLVTNCMEDADCTSGQICDIANGVCKLNLGCQSNADCPPNESCDVAANICQASCTAANASQVCGLKEVCFDSRCVECVMNSDCPTGTTCNPNSNICQGATGCMSNRDCAIPLVCNALTQQCTVNPGNCTSDVDCLSTESCDITDGQCVPATCSHDRYWQNNTLQTATPLPLGETDNLVLCANQVEYFDVALNNGDDIDVVFDGDSLAQMNLSILDPTGFPLTSSSSLAVDQIATTPGKYFVEANSPMPYVTYGLTINVTRGTPCPTTNELGAPGDTYLQAVAETQGMVDGVSLCPGDNDWFEITVPTGQCLTASLTTTITMGQLLLYLYDVNGTSPKLLASQTETSSTLVASANNFSTTTGYVEVVGATSQTENVYDLTFVVAPSCPAAADAGR